MEPSPTSRSYMSSMSSVGQLLLDNERMTRKLNKVRQRRDHYAKLYFSTLSELEETKWRLSQATRTIKELKAQGHVHPNSIPTGRRQVFHSNTTSPDSGASLSPGVESVEFGRHYQHSNPHSNVHPNPHSNSHSGHHGPVPRTTRAQYRNEVDGGSKWNEKSNSSRGGQGSSSRHLLKPHPTTPLMLHPPPASHPPKHPPSSHHPSAFSPTRPNFVKSWSLSVNNLSQQDTRQEHWHKTDTRDQWRSHPPATPLTASSNAAFTLPEGYREGLSHGGHTYQQSHRREELYHGGHAYQQSQHREAQQRSMTLPVGHAHPAARPTLRSQYTSLSQDDLLDGPVRSSAFHTPTQPQYPTFLKHYPDNLEISTGNRPTGPPDHTHNTYPGDHSHPSTPGGPPGGPRVNPPAAPRKQQSLEEVEEEEEEGGETYVCDKLSSVDMLDLLLNISSPHCQIRKLEVCRSQLGEPEAMKLLCNSLDRNRSITELSLPENCIGREALVLLLETIKAGNTNIKELKLRKNSIGQDCAGLIKEFLTQTSLDSLVLTGNEIEQFGHLLDGQLPNEFSMEC